MVLAMVLIVTMPLFAERVTPETARKVATTFLNNNGVKATQLTDLSKEAGFPNLYIFNGNPGFVVMAADDCVKPILGYSLTGKFVVEDMPENLRLWLQTYSDGIQIAIENRERASVETMHLWANLRNGDPNVAKTSIVVDALIQTKWAQRAPFNNLCPTGTPTGCVATAMAQIMNFYEWPQPKGIGQHSYIHSSYGEQSAEFYLTTYDWANMKDSYTSGYTQAQAVAVATLMYHCGVSMNMNYGPTGSGAFSIEIPSALINYFNYSKSTKYKSRYSNDSTSYWIADMKAELDAGRPMEYDGSSNSGGHSFICDGYDSDNKFHFNFGWANDSDGFFTIDGIAYNQEQGAVFGIKPAHCTVTAPTNFTASLIENTRDINLSWDAVTEATAYKLFRNGDLIQTINANDELVYTDSQIPYGTSVYYIRSVDSEGEMSLPSDYRSISIQFPAPTGLQAVALSNGHVNLTWNDSQNAESYNIYCNEVLIANTTNTTYEDNLPIPTNPSYFVKAVDSSGDESPASNSVSVSIGYNFPIVDDLEVTFSNEQSLLFWTEPSWCYPQNGTTTLSYGNGDSYYYWGIKYFAHRYPASTLSQHVGQALYKVSTKVTYVGTYTVYVFSNTINDQPDPQALSDTRVLKCSYGGWREIPLSHPITIEENQDLWIVIKQENTGQQYAIPSFNLSTHNTNAFYSGSSPTNLHDANPGINCAWFIKAYLTDGAYTYNLYDGETKLNGEEPITNSFYTVQNPANNTAHQYTVRTNYYGGESAASNMAGLTLGTASLNILELGENDKMTVTEGSELTVGGTLTNTNPANLILENGAELVHNTVGVKATVKKSVTPPSANDYGWYFIASPVTETVTPTTDNGFLNGTYDLYYYDEPTHYWMNYESSAFSLLPQKGYLYANEATNGTTLLFTGTLTPSNNSVTINGLSHSASPLNGFNLVGNPFACNATVDKDFYVVDNTTGKVILASNGSEIAPCAGIFVKATANDASVTFTKAASRVEPSSSSFDIVVKRAAQPTRDGVSAGSTTLDRARVRLSDSETLEKFSIGDGEGSVIYFPQDGQDLAVACANGQNEMPLNFKATENGTYTLSFEVDIVDLDYLHLIDNMTGNEVDVLAMPTYTFEAKTMDYASRFKLVFAEPTDGPSADDQPFAYYANGEIRIVADVCDAFLQVVDVTGCVVASVGEHTRCVLTTEMAPGVYVLRLINGDNVRTQKIVIE